MDLLGSISRLMADIVPREQREAAATIRELIAVYHENEDLISIGAYRKGSHPQVDAAIQMKPEIDRFLRQAVEESTDMATTSKELSHLAARCRQACKPAT